MLVISCVCRHCVGPDRTLNWSSSNILMWPSREPVNSRGAALEAGPASSDTARLVTVFWWLLSRATSRPPPRTSQMQR